MVTVTVLLGDITKMHVDAIGTLVHTDNSNWNGRVDQAIRNLATEDFYHNKLELKRVTNQLFDGAAIVIERDKKLKGGNFNHVIFVGDNLTFPLHVLVCLMLIEAERQRFHSIAIPLLRMGYNRGVIERTSEEVLDHLAHGIQEFKQGCPQSTMAITVVVHTEHTYMRILENNLSDYDERGA